LRLSELRFFLPRFRKPAHAPGCFSKIPTRSCRPCPLTHSPQAPFWLTRFEDSYVSPRLFPPRCPSADFSDSLYIDKIWLLFVAIFRCFVFSYPPHSLPWPSHGPASHLHAQKAPLGWKNSINSCSPADVRLFPGLCLWWFPVRAQSLGLHEFLLSVLYTLRVSEPLFSTSPSTDFQAG